MSSTGENQGPEKFCPCQKSHTTNDENGIQPQVCMTPQFTFFHSGKLPPEAKSQNRPPGSGQVEAMSWIINENLRYYFLTNGSQAVLGVEYSGLGPVGPPIDDAQNWLVHEEDGTDAPEPKWMTKTMHVLSVQAHSWHKVCDGSRLWWNEQKYPYSKKTFWITEMSLFLKRQKTFQVQQVQESSFWNVYIILCDCSLTPSVLCSNATASIGLSLRHLIKINLIKT